MTTQSNIRLVLSAATMGDDVDEVDFDLWTRFVCENIDQAVGFEVHEVEQAGFMTGGVDSIVGGTDEQRAAIKSWVAVTGWDAFCGEAWEKMRAEHDAKAKSEAPTAGQLQAAELGLESMPEPAADQAELNAVVTKAMGEIDLAEAGVALVVRLPLDVLTRLYLARLRADGRGDTADVLEQHLAATTQ